MFLCVTLFFIEHLKLNSNVLFAVRELLLLTWGVYDTQDTFL